ncbi:MAG: SBBP repeat-containing protein [bacterium]|nr:SBBP repeat-containing protein [bacterium]
MTLRLLFAPVLASYAAIIFLSVQAARPAHASGDRSGLGPVWSTYLGGTATPSSNTEYPDYAYGVTLDKAGNIFVVGTTCAPDWVSGGFDTTYGGAGWYWGDGYLAKFSPTGEYLWSTYLGGNNSDVMYGVAIDDDGNIYVTGFTDSEGWISGGFDTELDTSMGLGPTGYYYADAYVAKYSSDGVPMWSTYLGGGAREEGFGIALDAAGDVYVVGNTESEGWISGGYAEFNNGDGFVVKLSKDGAFLWSTYIGGEGGDVCHGVAVDSAGNVVICGQAFSRDWTSGGYDTSFGSDFGFDSDGFVVKLSSNGAHLWSTYLGGDQFDYARGIAIDSRDNIYITGDTKSSDWISGGFDTVYHGEYDAFLVKLSPAGNHLWSTYMGDSADDAAEGCAVDAGGYVYVTGLAYDGSWLNHWMPSAIFGGLNAFLARVSPDGSRLLWGYALGGDNRDNAHALAHNNSGDIYVVGETKSPGWTSGSWDTTFAGDSDGYLLKFIDKVGSLRVSITPLAAVAGGARWRRVGTSAWNESGEVEEFIPAGDYVIEFNDLMGWVKPANQTVSIVKDETATLNVTYFLDIGALSVTIEPAEAAAGARWRRVGTTTWLGGGGTEAGVPSGDYFIEFNDVAGWDKPVVRDCAVKFNQTTRLTVYYAPSGLNAADPKVWTQYE